jgi:hypothetical protein
MSRGVGGFERAAVESQHKYQENRYCEASVAPESEDVAGPEPSGTEGQKRENALDQAYGCHSPSMSAQHWS